MYKVWNYTSKQLLRHRSSCFGTEARRSNCFGVEANRSNLLRRRSKLLRFHGNFSFPKQTWLNRSKCVLTQANSSPNRQMRLILVIHIYSKRLVTSCISLFYEQVRTLVWPACLPLVANWINPALKPGKKREIEGFPNAPAPALVEYQSL